MDRYKEALAKARAGKSIEEIFPEIKESEDERIRKDLVNVIKWLINNPNLSSQYYKDRYPEMLAYLEKQKEQKPAEKQDYSGLSDLERAVHRGFLAAGVENVPVTIIKETAQECLAQMKPAGWSGEDRRTIDRACVILKAYANGELPDILPSEILECVDKLKSIRPQIIDNTPLYTIEQVDEKIREAQAWSEEDERMLDTISYKISQHQGRGKRDLFTPEESEFTERLKSLRPPQYCEDCKLKRSVENWKPSEEQMKALQVVVDEHWDVDGDALYSLYTDLKKLM